MTPGPPRTVVPDAAIDRELREEGWAYLPGPPFVTRDEARELRETFLAAYPDTRRGWHNSFNSSDLGYRAHIWSRIEEVVASRVREAFVDYEVFHFAFLCKWPGDDSFMFMHQDWTYIDASHGKPTYAVMIALEDIDVRNGAPSVVPRSHRHAPPIRGTEIYFDWTPHLEALESMGTMLPLELGRAVAWDNSILHDGPPNLTDAPRVAIGLGVRPRECPLVHYFRTGPDRAAMHRIDETFFQRQNALTLSEPPPGEVIAHVDLLPEHEAVGDVARRVAAMRAALQEA